MKITKKKVWSEFRAVRYLLLCFLSDYLMWKIVPYRKEFIYGSSYYVKYKFILKHLSGRFLYGDIVHLNSKLSRKRCELILSISVPNWNAYL